MMSLDEIWEDFRRNGRECDLSPIPDPVDRSVTYSPAAPRPTCAAWPPDNIPHFGKGSAFSVTTAQAKLARALNALNLGGAHGARPADLGAQRAHLCQHRGDRCAGLLGDAMISVEQANVLNVLQGNSLIHNELVKLIHEKAHELSQEYRSACRPDELWAPDPVLALPMQATRSSRRNRTNVWERRCDNHVISGRRSPVPRDLRFENRPLTQPPSRSSHRHAFNRMLNLEIPRDVEIDKFVVPQYFPPTPPASGSSSAPTTPDTISIPEEIPVKDVPSVKTTKLPSNGSPAGRKRGPCVSVSAPATPAPAPAPPSSSTASTPPATPPTPPGPPSPSPQDWHPLKDCGDPKAGAGAAAAPRKGGAGKAAAGAAAGARAKGSQSRRRASSESTSASTTTCAFCKKNGEAPSVFRGHVVKDAAGHTVCSILQKYVCPLCGATGREAHTVKHCPNNRSHRQRRDSARLVNSVADIVGRTNRLVGPTNS